MPEVPALSGAGSLTDARRSRRSTPTGRSPRPSTVRTASRAARAGRRGRAHVRRRRHARRRSRHRHGQDARVSRAGRARRPARADLHGHPHASGPDFLQGPAGARPRARPRRPRGLHEGPHQLSLPAPVRAAAGGRGRSAAGRSRVARARSPNGPTAPRPAIAPRSTTCRTTCRSGPSCPRRASSASAASARRSPTASSRACAKRAADADIVIVNHHLLCADASVRQGGFGEVIPECDLAVIDEAHQLEDVVTQVLRRLGHADTRRRVRARRARAPPALLPPEAATFAVALVARDDRRRSRPARRLFDVARLAAADARGRRGDRGVITPGMASHLHEAGRGARRGARAVRARGRESADRLRRAAGSCARFARAPKRCATISALLTTRRRRALRALRRSSAAAACSAARGADRRLGESSATPSLGDRHATVLTSATLAVEGSFDYALGRLGLAGRRHPAAAVGVRLSDAGRAVPARRHARSAVAASSTARPQRRSTRCSIARRAARSCCSRRTPRCAKCRERARRRVDVAAARAGRRRRDRRCCAISARRRTPCCWRPRASGRASTSPARR